MIKTYTITLRFIANSGQRNLLKKSAQFFLPKRHYSFDETIKQPQWDLVGSLCVERRPVITQDLNEIETRFKKYMEEMNVEKSHLSDHELRHIEDLKRLKEGKNIDINIAPVQTAQDFEDACEAELKSFTPASRITEDDLKNDQRSLNRALDKPLVLVVRQRLGKDYHWLLPQVVYRSEEDDPAGGLRATAQRALTSICGPQLVVKILGNAPFGFYKYKYPKAMREENSAIGAKVFFFKAHYISGQVDLSQCGKPGEEGQADFRWLSRTELEDYLHPDYLKAVRQIIVPVDPVLDHEHLSSL